MLNFIASYKDRKGRQRCGAFQSTIEGRRAKRRATAQIFAYLTDRHLAPQVIVYVPGDFTMQELERLTEEGPIPEFEITYQSLREIWAHKPRNGGRNDGP